MDEETRYQLTAVVFVAVPLAHALLTWPLEATAALFLGGAALAAVAEVLGVWLGLLRHHLQPQVLGVPVLVVPAWPATVYLFLRLAQLAVPGHLLAAGLAALLATGWDLLQEQPQIDQGLWEYPETGIPGPRIRGAPWWNYAAWLSISFVTALLPAPWL